MQRNYSRKLNAGKRKRDNVSGKLLPLSMEVINEKHTGALGLKAFVTAYPYDVPEQLPDILITLSEHVNDPQPIAVSCFFFFFNFWIT